MIEAEAPELHKLDPESIAATGGWLFWSDEPGDAFVQSIETMGQLEPILVDRETGGEWSLLDGYKRLQACLKLGRTVWARRLKADVETRGRIVFWGNRPRQLEAPECLAPARYFQSVCQPERARQIIDQLLKEHLSRRSLQELFLWLELPEWVDAHVRAGRLPMDAGQTLSQLTAADLDVLEPLFVQLSWSKNKIKQLLGWLQETSRREGWTIADLIERAGLQNLLQLDLSPKDRQQSILFRIKQLRYPFLSELEEEFRQLQTRVHRSTVWRISDEGGFETDAVCLSTRMASLQELRRAIEDLNRLSEHGHVQALFDWKQERLHGAPKPEPE